MSVALLLAAALSATPVAACEPQSRPWITLEVLAAEPAGDDAAQIVDIDAAGCATLRFAAFYRHAGLYRRQLDANELTALRDELARGSLLRFDPWVPQGKLWLSTNSGLSSLDPVTGRVRNYSGADGAIP